MVNIYQVTQQDACSLTSLWCHNRFDGWITEIDRVLGRNTELVDDTTL